MLCVLACIQLCITKWTPNATKLDQKGRKKGSTKVLTDTHFREEIAQVKTSKRKIKKVFRNWIWWWIWQWDIRSHVLYYWGLWGWLCCCESCWKVSNNTLHRTRWYCGRELIRGHFPAENCRPGRCNWSWCSVYSKHWGHSILHKLGYSEQTSILLGDLPGDRVNYF